MEQNGKRQYSNGNGRVVLCFAWGTRNAGDHALCLGALELLTAAVPQQDITVISRYGENVNAGNPTEDIGKRFPGVTVVPGPFPSFGDSLFGKLAEQAHGLALACTCMTFPRLAGILFRKHIALEALAGSRLVLLNGGNLFYWYRVRKSPARLIAFTFPLVMAARKGIPYGLLPQTSGPFEGLGGHLIGTIFKNATFTLFRDSRSFDHAGQVAAIQRDTTAIVPDLAFFLTPYGNRKQELLKRYGLEQNSFIAVVLRVDPLGYGVSRKVDDPEATKARVLKILPDTLASVSEKTGREIVIVVQTEDDAQISHLVHRRLTDEKKCPAKLIQLKDPYDFVALYSMASTVFSMRLHSMIFSLGQGTPVIGLWRKALGEKIPSMMQDLNLKDYAVELDSASSSALYDMIVRAVENRGSLSSAILSTLVEKKALARQMMAAYL